MTSTRHAHRSKASPRNHAAVRPAPLGRGRWHVTGGFVLFAAALVTAVALAVRLAAAPTDSAPGAQADWKSKGAVTAPVVVEEWGDFQ